MTFDANEWISRYLDDDLSQAEHEQLQAWLMDSAENASVLAQACLIHDRLLREPLPTSFVAAPRLDPPFTATEGRRRRSWLYLISMGTVAAVLALFLIRWGLIETPMSVAAELNRLIEAQSHELDRTYDIAVEEVAQPRRNREPNTDGSRPPKPPLEGALLHVRRGNQFVLIRKTPTGQTFITGSNGRRSWAIRHEGPVRTSRDLTRFNRDLPGHEHDIPLFEIERSLEQLRSAYDVKLLPIESPEDAAYTATPTRLLVAIKKRGHRGPQRVEINYAVRTGRIRQLRFVEMPYGPERLTVRMTLADERDLGPDFFDHASHHESDRPVEEE